VKWDWCHVVSLMETGVSCCMGARSKKVIKRRGGEKGAADVSISIHRTSQILATRPLDPGGGVLSLPCRNVWPQSTSAHTFVAPLGVPTLGGDCTLHSYSDMRAQRDGMGWDPGFRRSDDPISNLEEFFLSDTLSGPRAGANSGPS
jgi:hypothetical protein